jgi:exopolysaccharide biosynthesis polyprenyl glycosylphosphotransferase
MKHTHAYDMRPLWMFTDGVALFIAFQCAIYFRYHALWFFPQPISVPWQQLVLTFPWAFGVFWCAGMACGAYARTPRLGRELGRVIQTVVWTFLLLIAATFFYRGFSYSRGMVLFFMPFTLLWCLLGRGVVRLIDHRARHVYEGRMRVMLAGRSALGRTLLKSLLRHPDYQVVGRFETQPSTHPLPASYHGVPVVGFLNQLQQVCEKQPFDALIVVDRTLGHEDVLQSLETCMKNHVAWNIVPAEYELLLDRPRIEWVGGIPLIGTQRTKILGVNKWVKRVFDVCASSVLLVLCVPLMLAVACAVKMSSKGPVLYVQKRVGYKGQLFDFIKFRSMYVDNDNSIHQSYVRKYISEGGNAVEVKGEQVHKLVSDPRVFAVGQWIRKYSLDELPQLWNVLKGDMSLVGPRPALPYEVEVYRQWHQKRFEAPPGITGLWQVSGRNKLSFDDMVRLDISYLEQWTFGLDIEILLKTLKVVLKEKAH